jgi:hypothetical protein
MSPLWVTNVNLGSYSGGSDVRQGVQGYCLRDGESSPNCSRFLTFCNVEGLSVVQTHEHPGAVKSPERWSTWRHPRTGLPHMKDFVLIPLEEITKIKNCRPRPEADVLNNDHSLVFCKVNSSWAQLNRIRGRFERGRHGRPKWAKNASMRQGFKLASKVHALDLRSARNFRATRKFRDKLDKKFEPLESDWNLTEKALMESAVKCFPTLKEPWLQRYRVVVQILWISI